MTPEQYSQLTDGLERYGLPTLFALALLFLLYLLIDAIRSRIKSDGQNDLEDTKVQLRNADNVGILANVLQGNTAALGKIETAMNASVGAYEKLHGLQNEDHKLIEDIHKSESHITAHIDGIINPYQEVHKGHTEKLLSLQATGEQVLTALSHLRTDAQVNHTMMMTAINHLAAHVRHAIGQNGTTIELPLEENLNEPTDL